jgi:hypothetical protein
VNSSFPVAVDISVALTAKPVRFSEIDDFPIGKFQFITISGVMTIKAPSFFFRMMQFDGGMLVL